MEGECHDGVGPLGGGREAAGRVGGGLVGPLRSCGNHREPQEGGQRQRGDIGRERFSINRTAGQILAGLWKHLHPVPEASSELLLAHYWQLVLWAQPWGEGGTISSPSPGHTHTHHESN